MKWVSLFGFAIRLAVLLSVFRVADAASGADFLRWRVRQGRVDAQIESLELTALLGKIAAATDWTVFVEPVTNHLVSAKFRNATTGEALKLLLGNLNYALVPQRNGTFKLFVFHTGMGQATQRVEADKTLDSRASLAIPNERIVTLKPGAKEKIDELARRLGAKVVGKIEGLNSYQLQFADEAAARAADQLLARETGVESDYNFPVDRPVQPGPVSESGPSSFSLKPSPVRETGQMIVGLIDTAVQQLPAEMSGFVLPSIQVAGGAGGATPDLSHGTSMAETILHGLSLASEGADGTSSVRILPVDVYGNNEGTTTFDVARGIHAAINAGARVINLSLSGDGDNPLLANLILDARKQGILFYGAAGNEPTVAPTFPAAYPGVVAVTASDRRGNLAPYASRGSFVDVIAPGTSLVQFDGETFVVTGTSASTAYVSGTAAALRAAGQTPDQTDAAIREALAVKTHQSSPKARP
jgi:hypothetical protein